MCQYFNVDWEYGPFEPTEEDVQRWRLDDNDNGRLVVCSYKFSCAGDRGSAELPRRTSRWPLRCLGFAMACSAALLSGYVQPCLVLLPAAVPCRKEWSSLTRRTVQKDERIDMSLIQQGGCSLESIGPAGEWTWAFFWSLGFQRISIFPQNTKIH